MSGFDEPEVFGRYLLARTIADNGISELFEARLASADAPHKRLCVKRLKPHMADDVAFGQSFAARAAKLAEVVQPSLVTVLEIGGIDLPFLAMEQVDGPNLAQLLAASQDAGGIPMAMQVAIIMQAGQALAAVHAHRFEKDGTGGFVHGMLSPTNIMLTRQGSVKILDFGVAAAALACAATPLGYMRSKLPYTAPELLHGSPADARTDIYGLALLLYELAAGCLPHAGASDFELMRRICEGPTPRIGDVKPDIPEALATVIDKALSREPYKRHGDVKAFASELSSAATSLGGASPSAIAGFIERVLPAAIAAFGVEETLQDVEPVTSTGEAPGDATSTKAPPHAMSDDAPSESEPSESRAMSPDLSEQTVVDMQPAERLQAGGGELLTQPVSVDNAAGTAASHGATAPEMPELGQTTMVSGGSVVPVPLPAAAQQGARPPGEPLPEDLSGETIIVSNVGPSQRPEKRSPSGARRTHDSEPTRAPWIRRNITIVSAGLVALGMIVVTLIWAVGSTSEEGALSGLGKQATGGAGTDAAGVVRLTSKPAADISWQGQKLGSTPIDLEFPAGTHRLTVTQPQRKRVSTVLVRVKPGSRTTQVINLQSSTLSVLTTPSADVTIDGKKVGPTPLTRLHLAAGNHTVDLVVPRSGVRKRVPVEIKRGHDHRMKLDLGSSRP